MKSKLIIGNWKMNGDLVRNKALLEQLRGKTPAGIECAVCVPAPYLAQVSSLVKGSLISVGAQNLSEYSQGAYTGEVAAGMLRDFDCKYVLVGHSERRTLLGECDATVGRKTRAALDAGLVPVVCVGETLAERDAGDEANVLERQLRAVAAELEGDALVRVVVAYEPVWAIGTGRAASPEQVQAVMAFIRRWLATSVSDAESVPILYGGSVKAASAAELFSLPDVDGALVGGASLVAAEFIEICEAAVDAVQNGVCKSKVLDD